MNTYQKLPPQERMVIIAKIYHNAWYSEDRFQEIITMLDKWDLNPIREAKFLNQITDGTELTETEFR